MGIRGKGQDSSVASEARLYSLVMDWIRDGEEELSRCLLGLSRQSTPPFTAWTCIFSQAETCGVAYMSTLIGLHSPVGHPLS